MIPYAAPPVYPGDPVLLRPGRFASTIVRNTPELAEDPGAASMLAKCRVALIGMPDDTGVELNHGRPGAVQGPHAFREALTQYGAASRMDEPDDRPGYPRVFDAGDVVPGKTIHETHERVTQAVAAVVAMGLTPVGVGGGHDLTFPFVRAVAQKFGPLAGVYLDAHLDVRAELGSGMAFRSLLENTPPLATRLICVGADPLACTREHAAYLRSKGGLIERFDPRRWRTVLPENGQFVSLDLDVLDMAYAPGVSAMNPFGLSPNEAAAYVEAAGANPAVKCFDIMELSPPHDEHGRTARLAVHMFLRFLRGVCEPAVNNDVLIQNARVLTMGGAPGSRRGAAMRDLGILDRADVLVSEGRVARVERPPFRPEPSYRDEFDAEGRVLMPGFVDCHTHMCWAGSRIDEWERRLAGASYLEIQKSGGGIMSTVRAVRAATDDTLRQGLVDRALSAHRLGSTTIEVKSGYGLSLEHEARMLGLIKEMWTGGGTYGPSIIPTALLGHAIDADFGRGPEAFASDVIHRVLPGISRQFGPAALLAVDAFCEEGAWSLDQCLRLFERARSLGHPIRVHADQFNSLGMVPAALRLGARSIDHLEATTPADLAAIAASPTTAVLLPCCGFHLDGRYANGRAIIDGGGAVAVATNANPGSAPCWSMPIAMALAVRHCGLTCAEAIAAATINAAAVLGLSDRGYIAPGARADLILLDTTDERALAYEFGGNLVNGIISGGRLVQPPRG